MASQLTHRVADADVAALRSAVARRFPETVGELSSLVAVPGIAWPSFPQSELDRSAKEVLQLVRAAGIDDAEILRAPRPDGSEGGPAVVARHRAAPGQPTVLLYAHHDVQPPGDLSLWETEPFAATERNGRLYGRGSADDKAGLLVHLAAFRAAREVLGDRFGLGVTLFIEGEEEFGSPSFRAFLESYREELAADIIVVADSGNWAVGQPALTTSLRGLADGTFEVAVLGHSVHSGVFGGPILDAPTILARLIATLHDDDGNVAVAGLVAQDDADIDYPEDQFRRDAAVLDGVRLAGTGSIAARLWLRPALSIIGIDVPSVDVASNTIQARARAKFSLRLAPGQDPDAAMEALRAHLEANVPFGAHLTFTPKEKGNAYRADMDSAAAQTVLWALGESWGVPAVRTGMGGSIPFIADLKEVFPDAEVLITGVEDPDSRAHSANESLHLGDFEKCILAEALLLAALHAETPASL
ncbi:dipeptidase [Sinomonas cellulolyticus]|uniref:Dipeptidase n=1 Tax=Sinomonas cellulolyticus TaxID=2801916 RepID=A0ABS1K118_9MICC|nr:MULTISPECIES: dipeptidase [Sinomonas]MBL0705234.1 dipeptidase [Sinomonas cellulolyticus]